MGIETLAWDAAEHLDTPERMARYIEAALEDGDPALIAAAMEDVARARGLEAPPQVDALIDLLKTLGLRLSVRSLGPVAGAGEGR